MTPFDLSIGYQIIYVLGLFGIGYFIGDIIVMIIRIIYMIMRIC